MEGTQEVLKLVFVDNLVPLLLLSISWLPLYLFFKLVTWISRALLKR